MILLFVGEEDARIVDLSKANIIELDKEVLRVILIDDICEFALDDGNELPLDVVVKLANYLATNKNREYLVVNFDALIKEIKEEMLRRADA